MIDELEKKQSEMPSAFPNGNLFPGNRGLTIRDYFAAHVCAAFSATSAGFMQMGKATEPAALAAYAYAVADALMLVREKS